MPEPEKPIDEVLPEYNPIVTCSKCGKKKVTWVLIPDVKTGVKKVAHNFCGDICSECKAEEIKGRPGIGWGH
jgi:hypothetical protein